ncbi:MAG TPA: SDR family NAD(P)-dependent oxidoreductase, partial [Gammaproteobacteria bacterium]|nr:SDR family NAD(P)-dependent oxidoreductase [Gammaproteobacteria bacterium]
GDSRRVAAALEQDFRSRGQTVVRVENGPRFRRLSKDRFVIDPFKAQDFSRLLEILEGENRMPTDVVHLLGLSFQPDGDETAPLEVQQLRCTSSMRMLQALHCADRALTLRIWLVTGRAAVLDLDDDLIEAYAPIPSQAPLWGLGRVIANEHSNLHCRLVDLWVDESADGAAHILARELERDDDETEVVLTKESRYVSRMRRAEIGSPPQPVRVVMPAFQAEAAAKRRRKRGLLQSDSEGKHDQSGSEGESRRENTLKLQIDHPGSLSRLEWVTAPRKRPGSGEVEIIPRAIGLNFRDLMFASGMLPEEAIESGYAGATLGMECAGLVTGLGSDVSDFRIGDEVMAFAPACFSSHVVAGAHTVVRKRESWSFEQAATVPVAFFTAIYALKHLASLERGERVLIHGAAGGVGIAAIQYARHCGAEIFATAGSEEKRDFLRLAGVEHVFDSRSLDFADEIMARTRDEGVDVVLNSLSGEALARSLTVLRPFGRFLELGKRDFYQDTRVGLRPFRHNLSYFGIDADQLLVERPDVSRRVFREMMALFDQAVFTPLPYRVFSASRAGDAFRFMQRSEHIGKIVVARDKLPVPVRPSAPAEVQFALKPDATYLVTGGLSGFGLATARWMVDRGARCLVLLGRSGLQNNEARTKIEELEKLGALVRVLRADVADDQSLRQVFERIDRDLPPLRGLVHSAMVVDDKLVRDLDEKRMHRVLSPKLLGAWNLHALTKDRALDFFVLYSSATTSFGNPGLGNYVAANIYLESLTRLRRSQGLPATAVAWGPISDSGYLARNDAALRTLTAFMGSGGLTTRQGFDALELLLQADAVCGAVLEFDWSVVRRALPAGNLKRYEELNRQSNSDVTAEQPKRSARLILTQLPLKEARAVITDAVIQIVARILRLPPDQVDRDASIVDLGMDSLMAIEMHMSVNKRFGVNLPVMGLADFPTIDQLVGRIIDHEQPGAGATEKAAAVEDPAVAEEEAGAQEDARARNGKGSAAHTGTGDD